MFSGYHRERGSEPRRLVGPYQVGNVLVEETGHRSRYVTFIRVYNFNDLDHNLIIIPDFIVQAKRMDFRKNHSGTVGMEMDIMMIELTPKIRNKWTTEKNTDWHHPGI